MEGEYRERRALEAAKKINSRTLFQSPQRVLDAPGLLDDSYVNILDWSARDDLAIALDKTVYLWRQGQAEELFTNEGDHYVCALSWIHDATCLAVSLSNGTVQLWDVTKNKRLRTLAHSLLGERITALSWNKHLLSSAAQDGSIQTHDVRIAKHLARDLGTVHKGGICGLKWSPDGRFLASGAKDNMIAISNNSNSFISYLSSHNSTVRALAWCPWQPGLLLSGGGSTDSSIKLWDVIQSRLLDSYVTDSQVCSIHWSKTHRQFISTHGGTENSIRLCKYLPKIEIISQVN